MKELDFCIQLLGAESVAKNSDKNTSEASLLPSDISINQTLPIWRKLGKCENMLNVSFVLLSFKDI